MDNYLHYKAANNGKLVDWDPVSFCLFVIVIGNLAMEFVITSSTQLLSTIFNYDRAWRLIATSHVGLSKLSFVAF